MKKKSTLEGKAKTRNGVLRLCFCLFCILLEVISIVLAVLWLNDYVEYLNIATRILAGIIALILYSKNKPSTMKMPWVILMLIFPIMSLWSSVTSKGARPRSIASMLS